MLLKCETKSNRVKGVAFHPKLTWILSSLHNGTIQLWDYQLSTLLDKFEEHEGPVRSVCFHATQPLFVSGGDDYKVKVWNYKFKRCIFTLLGHLDYIRTVHFHNESPWICSASDDQTIRVWNWYSRQCIAVLTGHNHYVMSARFHPKDDLLVSASLDQTARVWDISALRERSSSAGRRTPEVRNTAALLNQATGGADVFGTSEAVTKHILEGHDRGVNWADFHPTQPLVLTGSDDRLIKIWKMSDSRAWEIDSLRGHSNNVSSVCFHPRKDLIVSDSEDKTLRVWDATKRTCLATWRSDRFWVIACHPTNGLVAAGHDAGMLVFKLDKERPMFAASSSHLLVLRDRNLCAISLSDGSLSSASVSSCGRAAPNSMVSGLKSLVLNTMNSTELNVLVKYDQDEGFDLMVGNVQSARRVTGSGIDAAFVARNRFAVLNKDGSLGIYSLQNELTKRIEAPFSCDAIFAGGNNRLILKCDDRAVLFDVSTKAVVGTLVFPGLKQVYWSSKMDAVALVSKQTVTLADASLNSLASIQESTKVKSGLWDDSAFLYSTLSHVKYLLPFGESGVIQSLAVPLYLAAINSRAGVLVAVDREGGERRLKFSPAEYYFKLALRARRYDEVKQWIKQGRLCGNVVIGYLKRQGFPEVALQFVEDPSTRFTLALEFAHIDEALAAAEALDTTGVWVRLAKEAMKQGNVQVAEHSLKKAKDFEGLCFLYVITANTEKLAKLAKVAEARGDLQGRFAVAALTGDVDGKVKVLNDGGLQSLAKLASTARPLKNIKHQTSATNWELTSTMDALFANHWVGVEQAAVEPIVEQQTLPDDFLDAESEGDEVHAVDDSAWGGGFAELTAGLKPVAVATKSEQASTAGEAVEKKWLKKRKLPADLVAAGEFDEALNLLSRRIDLVNPLPLVALFTEVFASTRCAVPGLPLAPSLLMPLLTPEGLPLPIFTAALLMPRMKDAQKLTTLGKFDDAVVEFRSILASLTLAVAETAEEEIQLRDFLDTAKEYAIAMIIASRRAALPADQVARSLELASYLTTARLHPSHVFLVTKVALSANYKANNYITAAAFAQRLLTGSFGAGQTAEFMESTRGILQSCEHQGQDRYSIEFDATSDLDGKMQLCCGSLTRLGRTEAVARCSFCGSTYNQSYKGKTCSICNLSAIGGKVLGIQFRAV